MGGLLDKPITEKIFEEGEGPGLRYVAASMQGWREDMEDEHVAKTNIDDGAFKDWSYFAVFDGHSGDTVAKYCAEHLLDAILSSDFSKDVRQAIRNGFLKLDDEMRTLPDFQSGIDSSGSTAVCAFLSPTHIYVANCGDSRAVLCRKGKCAFATVDHKPSKPDERRRICNAGGSVWDDRVNGALAVSRSLGDYSYKEVKGKEPHEQYVIAEPEIFVLERDGEEEFLALACDGIWDAIKNEEICTFVMNRFLVTEELKEIASQVIDHCFEKPSHDNMTLVLVVFPKAPKPTPEAIQAEINLDAEIEKCLRDYVETQIKLKRRINSSDVCAHVRATVKGLPPGGERCKNKLCYRLVEQWYPDGLDLMYHPVSLLK